MVRRSAGLAAVGLTLGAALSPLATAGGAHAAAQGVNTTVQAGSNIRAAATTNSRHLGTTRSVSTAAIQCHTRGQYVKVGAYGTEVWYFGNVFDDTPGSPHGYIGVWVWGGNVNVGADPHPDVPRC
ncbi:hypothetical protein RND61_01350 [Streptomyces sp. TRM76323]|uniref:SH3b domain-containing protein n=1 Tax=Streptomyces tamarix TaxID=3078565 RepID=A0ABU3QD93_9ACTN|nr:hypothetical protein [Streptomyces tamarix]MDT9680740.1 hypothetical protein [Streptomyces tamarix]